MLFQGAKRTSGDTNTLSIDADGLKIDVLAAAARNIRMTARIAEESAFTGKLADTGHRKGWFEKLVNVPKRTEDG
jgi:hypothetical protein